MTSPAYLIEALEILRRIARSLEEIATELKGDNDEHD